MNLSKSPGFLAAAPFIQLQEMDKSLAICAPPLCEIFGEGSHFIANARSTQLALLRAGIVEQFISPYLPDNSDFQCAFITPKANKQLTMALIAGAAQRTRIGGKIIISGDKRLGLASIQKKLAQTGLIIEKNSKAHAVALCFQRPEKLPTEFDALCLDAQAKQFSHDDKTWTTSAGVFSHGKVDKGSALLMRSLPDKITGRVADFGAGWGYCARQLAENPNITGVELFEDDWMALEHAKQNLANVSAKTSFHWHDIEADTAPTGFDAVVMNPPFHTGRQTRTDLGQTFIKRAHQALKNRGILTMVANRHLPYERTLNELFGNHLVVADKGGFKVLSATKRG